MQATSNMPSVPSPSVASPALLKHNFWSRPLVPSQLITSPSFCSPFPVGDRCYCADENLMGSGHTLSHLLWHSGLHHRSALLLMCCLCKCPPWAWPQLFHPQATLSQMHLLFSHPSCLPGHGSIFSSADRPHGVSRACAREGSCWENRHQQMQSQSVIIIVAWVQAADHILLEWGVRASQRPPVSLHSPANI